MGQEIDETRFTAEDFAAFDERLRSEQALLEEWFAAGAFACGPRQGGFELEAWLVGPDLRPAPLVGPMLRDLDDPAVVPELATFNCEINGPAIQLSGAALTRLAEALTTAWRHCGDAAAGLGTRLAMIGILPTVEADHLTLAYMTPRRRYRALNDQIFALRRGRPLTLEIHGHDRLFMEREDVMIEAAATSFQIHLEVDPDRAVRIYNASKILSAPIVATAANSPYLFGCDLWAETRIPLFEQAVSLGGSVLSERVNFGIRYAERSILECFQANLTRYPILLPQLMDEPRERLAHLRLHNGTIWRWNRPLIGFDATGAPRLRIEHRVIPSGPTVADCIANAAFYFGAVEALARQEPAPEAQLPFLDARTNFYAAAREGLEAEIRWLDGRRARVSEVIATDLLPRALAGLVSLGIDRAEADHWLAIVAARVRSGQTGAAWQRAWVARHGRDTTALTAAYLERQQGGQPVHEWTLE
jgi:hypothetical protein